VISLIGCAYNKGFQPILANKLSHVPSPYIRQWSGGELSSSPSYKQLAGYTVRMLDKMVGGKLEKIGVNQVATIEQITVKDARRPGGKTTRRRLEKVTQYEMNFPASGEAKLTALDRVKMLKKLDL
jgi:hypothetical protein